MNDSNELTTSTTREDRNSELLPTERSDFIRLNTVITNASEGFVLGAFAMQEINERRLYREKFPTFKAYCESVNEISRSYAYKLMKAGRIAKEILPIVTINGTSILTNESQIRELARIPSINKRKELAYELVKEKLRDPDVNITASFIGERVDAILGGKSTDTDNNRITTAHLRKRGKALVTQLKVNLQQGSDGSDIIAQLERLFTPQISVSATESSRVDQ